MERKTLIPHTVIVAAQSGDPDAMGQIMLHYSKVIDFHSQRTVYDEYGNARTSVDPEIRHRIQAKLMDKVIREFDPWRLPEGETLDT